MTIKPKMSQQDMIDILTQSLGTEQKVQRFHTRMLSSLIEQERKTLNLPVELICCAPQILPTGNSVPVCIIRRGWNKHVAVSVVSAVVIRTPDVDVDVDHESANVKFNIITKVLTTRKWSSIWTAKARNSDGVLRTCTTVLGLDVGFTSTHSKTYCLPQYGMERFLFGGLAQAVRGSHDQVMFGTYQGSATFHDYALSLLQLHHNPEDPMYEDAGENFAILKRFLPKEAFISCRDKLLAEFKKVLK